MQGKVDQHTGKPVRSKLIASTRPTRLGSTSLGENCRVQTMEVELWQRPPTRRAEDLCLRPTTHRSTGLRVHARSCVGMPARLDTMRRMHTTQRSDPNREHDFASRMVDLFRAVTLAHRHALNPNGPRRSRGRPHHERAQTTPVTQEIRNTLTDHHSPTGTNPIDAAFGAESTHTQCHGRRISRLPPPQRPRRGRAVRWALMSAMQRPQS
jgi:hypothetical protein